MDVLCDLTSCDDLGDNYSSTGHRVALVEVGSVGADPEPDPGPGSDPDPDPDPGPGPGPGPGPKRLSQQNSIK